MKNIRDVIILNLDGVPDKSGDFFDTSSKVTWDFTNIDITNDMGDPIGRATPIIQSPMSKILLADLQFFDKEFGKYIEGYPCFNGKVIRRIVNHVLEARLTSITVAKQNADSRIPNLGYYFGYPSVPAKVDSKECKCERLIFGHDENCSWVRK